jgi:hypothetical protein
VAAVLYASNNARFLNSGFGLGPALVEGRITGAVTGAGMCTRPARASQAPDGPATATHPSGASSPQLRRRCPLGRPFCFQPPCRLARLGSTPSPCPLPPLAPVVLRLIPPPPSQPRARCSLPRPPLYLGAQHTNASALLSRARASPRAPGSCGRGARQCAHVVMLPRHVLTRGRCSASAGPSNSGGGPSAA